MAQTNAERQRTWRERERKKRDAERAAQCPGCTERDATMSRWKEAARGLVAENKRLRQRLAELEAPLGEGIPGWQGREEASRPSVPEPPPGACADPRNYGRPCQRVQASAEDQRRICRFCGTEGD